MFLNVDMLSHNKNFMLNYGLPAPLEIPAEVTPITLTALPMSNAAEHSIDIDTDDDFIRVHVYGCDATIVYTRIPERRSLWRRIQMANTLREVAKLYSLESFLTYIADCGFKAQA